ncbi:hypothetical protein JW968_01035 [Candidatus Woesearchaeota archaeon]|nr:hypothetical protein [Candidatus Woesearchaeota archaeon]
MEVESKGSFAYLAIVAIVAIVALVVLITGKGPAATPTVSYIQAPVTDDLGGDVLGQVNYIPKVVASGMACSDCVETCDGEYSPEYYDACYNQCYGCSAPLYRGHSCTGFWDCYKKYVYCWYMGGSYDTCMAYYNPL